MRTAVFSPKRPVDGPCDEQRDAKRARTDTGGLPPWPTGVLSAQPMMLDAYRQGVLFIVDPLQLAAHRQAVTVMGVRLASSPTTTTAAAPPAVTTTPTTSAPPRFVTSPVLARSPVSDSTTLCSSTDVAQLLTALGASPAKAPPPSAALVAASLSPCARSPLTLNCVKCNATHVFDPHIESRECLRCARCRSTDGRARSVQLRLGDTPLPFERTCTACERPYTFRARNQGRKCLSCKELLASVRRASRMAQPAANE